MTLINKLRKLTLLDWFLTIEAGVELLKAWLLIHLTPFSFYSKQLGTPVDLDYSHTLQQKTSNRTFILKKAVLRFARRSPFPSRCLAQAIAIRQMMKRRNLDCELFLGIKKNNQQLLAHAWTKCGEEILTGAKGHEQFTIIGHFLTISQPVKFVKH